MMAWNDNFRAIALLWTLLTITLIFLTLSKPVQSQSASFYGASYLKVPLQDAQRTTYIYFRFRTHRPSTFLFLAAGSSDYCFVMLENGEIQVRINLGAGEAILSSTPGLSLNDLMWHELELHRTDAELTLIVDSLHKTYLDIPGRFFELNVKYGVFIGGVGGFNELFLGNVPNFRGCIDDVIFNNHDVLKIAAASSMSEETTVFSVTWNCSDEFEAQSHQAISFMKKDSFFALPSWNARNGGSVTMDVKTQTHSAVLFYNAGVPLKYDFISLEILEGKCLMSVNEGNGVVELKSDVFVSDGRWHHIETQFSQSYMELVVDGQMKNLRPGLGTNRFFDLAGFFYVGGIELNKQSRALQDGLQSLNIIGSADSSLTGCIKDLKVNDKLLGFREAEVTHGLHPDCGWEYMCLQEPCIPEAECHQDGMDSFRCICNYDNCVRSNFSSGYKLYTKSSKPIDLEILNLQPLVLSEGGSDLITSNHIRVILDYEKYGIRESGVLFHIIEAPQHGSLEIEIWRRTSDDIFSLPDLNTNKVRYSHDGSETKSDVIVFDLEFRAANFRLPSFLDEKHRFVFHIQIIPVNDPPTLKLSASKVFRLAKFTRKTITSDFLKAEDPDNTPDELLYTVLHLGSLESEGYVENAKNPNKCIYNFTQEDINNGLIRYYNRGAGNVRISLRVSDEGSSDQITSMLKIVPFDLEVTLVNNTGIIMPYGSFAIISTDNLTFTDNALDQNLELRFNITKQPEHGNVRRLQNNGRWYTVNHFSRRQLRKRKLAYFHTTGKPAYDQFSFTVSSSDVKFPTVYNFQLNFMTIILKQIHNTELLLNRKLDAHITETDLKFDTHPISTSTGKIIYILLTVPSFGNLIHFQSGDSESRHKKLEENSTFTQLDVNSRNIKYKLHRKSYSVINDQFTFRVSISESVNSDVMEFRIKHLPVETDAIIINEKVTVLEGGTSTIGPSELLIEIPSASQIVYNVTTPPKHGILKKLNFDHMEIEEEFVHTVTSEEISQNRLVYVHDDSETERDLFHFIASTSDSTIDSFVYYGTVHIHVIMKNDNPPTRAVEKIFNVVLDGERKLTGRDLKYVDPDIDSTQESIQYTLRNIPNGALYHIDDLSTQISQFTQVDLNSGKVVFRHSGVPYGKALLRITDGKFYASGVLEIRASKPYINITKNTGLFVKRGETSLITSSNLTVETNLNVNSDDITFKITSSPKHGQILSYGKAIHLFTQKDVRSENVEYENDNSISFQDSFSFSAFMEDIIVEEKFEFRIFPESYWEPLKIVSNNTLYVDEEKTITINASYLNISQTNINTNNISYIVTTPPRFGFLFLASTNEFEDWKSTSKTLPLKFFSQSAINQHHLHYNHTEINSAEDNFVLDVTNGITKLRGLIFSIKIISKSIFLRTNNITVNEGGNIAIKSTDIRVTNPYYEDWIEEYLVIEKPQHGFISFMDTTRSRVLRFNDSSLRNGFIHYIHDGSETTRDWFTLVANATALNKESLPSTVHVIVVPVNDESPHIVNNTGLDVWEGDITVITNSHLAAADDDSDPSDINFVISSPSNGYIAMINDTKTPILNFKQEQINHGMVVFVHTGDKAGGFKLQVNDGMNIDSPHIFTITARVLQIIIATNEKLSILPRMQQSITKDHLFVTTNDHDLTRVIDFKVTQSPKLGRLLVENPDGSLTPVSRFTQEQINKNLVLYEHNKPMVGLTLNDVFKFNIETQNAQTVKDVDFLIEIAVGNFASGNIDQIIVLHPLHVKEGGIADLSQEQIDMSKLLSLWQGKGKSEFARKMKIVLLSPPSNGWLETEDENSNTTSKLTFNREDIRKKRVQYHHDDSDTFNDSFSIGFFLLDDKGYPDILLFNGTINVIVYPINDNPFVLVTRTAVLEVVQEQSLTIGPQVLNVSDADKVPSDIVYEIMKSPKYENLMMRNITVLNFTQEDINNRLVQYIHNGTKENRIEFSFKVSDGKHKPDYAVLNIVIVPIELHLVNISAIEVQQARTTVFLSRKNLGAETNANNENIWYNITSLPLHGHIFVNDSEKRFFRQKDISSHSVSYIQTDLTASEDYFLVNIHSGNIVIENQFINITVVPLVVQKVLIAKASGITYMTIDYLNASKLASLTKSNPKYLVFKLPKYGVLRKLNSKFRSKRSSQRNLEFTHNDILNKRVYYEGKDMEIRGTAVDSFEYILTASEVQPAKGKFTFTVQSSDYHFSTLGPTRDLSTPSMKPPPPPLLAEIGKTLTTTTEPSSTINGSMYPASISIDHLLIAGVILGVVIVSITVIIIIKCRSGRSGSNKNKSRHQCFGHHHKSKTVAGSQTAQSDLELSDPAPSNHSLSLSDDIPPPPPPPTSPSCSHNHLGCMGGSGSSKNRTLKKKSKCMDSEPSLPPPPYILENGEWTEINVPLPTCKVTPLPQGEQDEINETTLKGPYLLSDPSECEDWSNYEGSELRFGPPCNPVLRKNQYWV